MGTATETKDPLAQRLRELRTQLHPTRIVRQIDVATALGVSNATVSAWEKPGGPTVPEDRLEALARFFATPRSIEDSPPSLINELSDAEHQRSQEIMSELRELRQATQFSPPATDSQAEVGTGTLGGRFWHFPNQLPVHIITSQASELSLTSASAHDGEPDPIPRSNPWHPNYLRSLWDSDRDATIELYGHIRAENPHLEVKYLPAGEATADDLTANVVILGNSCMTDTVAAPLMDFLRHRLEWEWFSRVPTTDVGQNNRFDGEFVITLDDQGIPAYLPRGADPGKEEAHGPVFLPDFDNGDHRGRRLRADLPILEYDVAMLARRRNELNVDATITVASGVFSRGTLGAVRALTHPTMRRSNEKWLYDNVDPQDFWMLLRVPVYPSATGLRTVVPDLDREYHRIHTYSRRLHRYDGEPT